MENKEKFRALFKAWVKRPGTEKLLAWLETTDFFEAPASTKYHGAYPGGLVEHSLNVCRELVSSNAAEQATTESMVLCALLHDVCKVNYYAVVGIGEGGKTIYQVTDKFPFGHGEKAVYLISRFMCLSDEEALAIRWHMGPYDDAARGGSRTLSAAMAVSPFVYELHAADMRALQREQWGESGGAGHEENP